MHGALHLVGYDHEADDGEMLAARTRIVERLAPVAAGLRNGDETPRPPRGARRPFAAAGVQARAASSRSFNYAFEGVIYVVRTQRNMRIHFLVALARAAARRRARRERDRAARAASSRPRSCSIAEMINTALEKAIDIATTAFDPAREVAKDIAAGAVLVCGGDRLFVGYLVFAARACAPVEPRDRTVRDSPTHLSVIAIAVVILLVIAIKARFGPARRFAAGSRPATRPSRSAAGRRSRSSPRPTSTRCWSRRSAS